MGENTAEFVHREMFQTELKPKTIVFQWRIRNFKLFVTDRHNNVITSTSKLLSKRGSPLWSVNLHINNPHKSASATDLRDKSNFYYLHAYVAIDPDVSELNKNYDHSFFVYVIKADGTEEEVFQKANILQDGKTQITVPNFKPRNSILDETNKLLLNGDLTLKFKLCGVTGNLVSRSVPIFLDSHFGLKNELQFPGFENLLNNEKFSDVKLIVDNKELYAYKGILADRSPVFAAMFEHDMKESIDGVVRVDDINYQTMQELLRFIYAGKVNGIEAIASDLLSAADKYGIEDLKLMCEKILVNNLKIDTVISLLIFAVKNSAKSLQICASEFFKFHVKEIVKLENYDRDIKGLLVVFPDIVKLLAM